MIEQVDFYSNQELTNFFVYLAKLFNQRHEAIKMGYIQ